MEFLNIVTSLVQMLKLKSFFLNLITEQFFFPTIHYVTF